MKSLVISDIHGRNEYIEYMLKLCEEINPDKIYLLGDIMSSYYDQALLLEFLNKYKDKLILIRGNCDFPLAEPIEMSDLYKELINGKVFLFTHGHLLHMISLDDVDVVVSGHTHENLLVKAKDGIIYFNPGSIAFPRGNTVNSYGLITDDELVVKDINGEDIKRMGYTK